jgi:addiction module HigA family antidote
MSKTILSPGAVLLGMLDKYNLNCNRLSKGIKCSQTALRLISLDKSRITTSIALRLAKYFGTTPEFWLNTQMQYDLSVALKNKKIVGMLKGISKVQKPAGGKAVKAKPGVKKTNKK